MKNKRCYQTCETRSVETEIPCGGGLTFNIQNPQEVLGWGLEMRDYPRHYTVINDSVSRWVELGDILKRWNSAHKPHFSIRAVSQSGSETFLLAYPPSIDHLQKKEEKISSVVH